MASPLSVPKGMNLSTLRAVQPEVKRHMRKANWERRPIFVLQIVVKPQWSQQALYTAGTLAYRIRSCTRYHNIIYIDNYDQWYQLICIIIYIAK